VRPLGLAFVVCLLALAGVSFLYIRQLIDSKSQIAMETKSDPLPLAQSHGDEYYLCKDKILTGWPEFSLVLKYSGNEPAEILWEGKKYGRFERFRITEHDDVYYQADEVSADVPEAFGSLKINRLNGELVVFRRISQKAVKLLVDVCDKTVPVKDCGEQMNEIPGGNNFTCGELALSFSYCDKWRRGGNISGQYRYQCHPTDRKF
jgi:hypothetical protein